MSKDPYKVLGVSPNADDETIKRVYHELARKYHPDRYTNSDFADLANEKMQEVNAAYDQIQEMRAAERDQQQKTENGGASGKYYGNGGDFSGAGAGNYQSQSRYSAEAREKFVLIRNCINSGNVTEAERLLGEIDVADRGAEWHFLVGCVQLRRGFYVDAQRSFDTAYRMEPTNNEYWQFKEKTHQRAQDFGGGYNTTRSGGCCDCDTCSTLLVADCCCECMGGDLIPCC